MKTLVIVIAVAFAVSLIVIGLAAANNVRRFGPGDGPRGFFKHAVNGWRHLWSKNSSEDDPTVYAERRISLDEMFAANQIEETGYVEPQEFERILGTAAQQLGFGRKN